MYGDHFTVTSNSDLDTFIAIIVVLIPIILLIITIVGIWNIHKSIDKQTAVQIRQAEALEQLLFEIRNENGRKNHMPQVTNEYTANNS